MQTCLACHGADGRSREASRLAGREIDFGDPAWQDAWTDEKILARVRTGYGQMPAFPELPEGWDEAILAHLRSLRRGPEEAPPE